MDLHNSERTSWLDDDPPKDPSLALAYWCEMDYFLSHTAYGDHPPCECPDGQGHNDPKHYKTEPPDA